MSFNEGRKLETTKRLSIHARETNYEAFPEEAINRAKTCLLDWVGSAYCGIGSPTERIAYGLIKEMGGRGASTIVGSEDFLPPMQAALYNGMISAVEEIDDVHEETALHPGTGVIPAALAVSEYAGSSGKELIASIIIGYDISVRMSRAAGPSHYRFWHSTGTCNTFGAAAAAAKLLHLDVDKLTMALGLAGTQASGLWESINQEATMAKHLHSGKAASNGILSAFLARDGFRGSETIIQGERGFLASSSNATDGDLMKLTAEFGRPFLIMKNVFKRYACCRGCFEGMEGVYRVFRDNHLEISNVEKIVVTMEPNLAWMVGNGKPKGIYEAKFSLPFCMALMVIKGEAGLNQFSKENLNSPPIRGFMEKVEILKSTDPISKVKVNVICKGGPSYSSEPEYQPMSLQEVREKFIRHVSPLLSEEQVDNILSSIENLEKFERVGEFTKPLQQRVRQIRIRNDLIGNG